MAEDVVGRRRLLDPPRLERSQRLHPLDGLRHVPDLVGIDHQFTIPADFLADDAEAANVVRQVATHLHLNVVPPLSHRLAAQAANFVVRITQPSGAGGVSGVTLALEPGDALGLAWFGAAQQVKSLGRRQGIGQVAEIHAGHELFGREPAHQLPNRHSRMASVQVPQGIDDGG